VESDPDVQALLERFQVGVNDVPVVVCESGQILKNPTIEGLATGLGLSPGLDAGATRDVVIIGAGPAGLAAAVYAASEGLDVLVLESTAPGGQAGSSSRIENYLGFPAGISGQDLALDCSSRPYRVHLASGDVVRTKTIVIASGANQLFCAPFRPLVLGPVEPRWSPERLYSVSAWRCRHRTLPLECALRRPSSPAP
jgi:thioredoxin reductase (NADPH)